MASSVPMQKHVQVPSIPTHVVAVGLDCVSDVDGRSKGQFDDVGTKNSVQLHTADLGRVAPDESHAIAEHADDSRVAFLATGDGGGEPCLGDHLTAKEQYYPVFIGDVRQAAMYTRAVLCLGPGTNAGFGGSIYHNVFACCTDCPACLAAGC